MDLYDILTAQDDSQAQAKAQALAQMLRQRQDLGQIMQASGFKALEPIGAQQEQQAAQQQSAIGQMMGQRLKAAMEKQQMAQTEKHQNEQTAIAREQLEQGKYTVQNIEGTGKAIRLNNKTGKFDVIEVVPPGQMPKDKGKQNQVAAELRKEFFGNPTVKNTENIGEAYQKIKGSESTAAGDVSLIYGYMKLMDPGSTVREGEFATAQNAGSIPERVQAAYNRALKGTRLAPEVRADFLKQADNVYQAQLSRYKPLADEYGRLAKQSGLEPNDVVLNLGFDPAPTAPIAAAPVGPHGPSIVQKGFTYNWNPATGKYE